VKEFRTRSLGSSPVPPASSAYRVVDDGNCSPRFMRLTINQFPGTKELANKIAIPLAVVLQPLAHLPPSEQTVPLISDLPEGPIRCKRCRAYINCHVTFLDGGRHWTCNLCGMMNPVEPNYFCTLDHLGKRRDMSERPELCFGSVDFIASSEYFNRPAMAPAYMFAIDVSMRSVECGLVASAVESIIAAIQTLMDPMRHNPNTMFGLVTFDTQLHFFNLDCECDDDDSLPSMSVVPDLEDPFVPSPKCVVNLAQRRSTIEKLLRSLPRIFAANKEGESAVGSALVAASKALEPNGGKVIAIFGSPPTMGVGKVSRLDDAAAVGTDREKKILSPHDNFYQSLSQTCVTAQVSVDLIACMCSPCFLDLVSMGQVCKFTGGQLSYMQRFDPNLHAIKLHHELVRRVSRPTGLEAVLRVRCCTGLSVEAHYGSFNQSAEGDIELPAVDADKTMAVKIKMEADMPVERKNAAIQCALLYTAPDGTRRIRVHTISIPITTNISTIFRSSDLDALINFCAKKAVADSASSTLDSARTSLIQSCVQILYVYRKYCATNPAPGQLILPESLKLLPLYTLGLLKNRAFVGDTAIVKTDERYYYLHRLMTLSAAEMSTFVYPRLFSLHSLGANHGCIGSHGDVSLPPTISLAAEKLDMAGVYLLDNGETMYMWIGKSAPRSFLQQVFNVSNLGDNDAIHLQLVEHDNDLSRRVVAIVDQIRSRKASFPIVEVMQQKDILEAQFFSYLVEDRAPTVVSYVDFLCHIHSQIQSKLV